MPKWDSSHLLQTQTVGQVCSSVRYLSALQIALSNLRAGTECCIFLTGRRKDLMLTVRCFGDTASKFEAAERSHTRISRDTCSRFIQAQLAAGCCYLATLCRRATRHRRARSQLLWCTTRKSSRRTICPAATVVRSMFPSILSRVGFSQLLNSYDIQTAGQFDNTFAFRKVDCSQDRDVQQCIVLHCCLWSSIGR